MDEVKRIIGEIMREDGITQGKIVFEYKMIPEIINRSGRDWTETYVRNCVQELSEEGYLDIESEIGWNFTERWFNELGINS